MARKKKQPENLVLPGQLAFPFLEEKNDEKERDDDLLEGREGRETRDSYWGDRNSRVSER